MIFSLINTLSNAAIKLSLKLSVNPSQSPGLYFEQAHTWDSSQSQLYFFLAQNYSTIFQEGNQWPENNP